jgi:hypothetical protein
MINTCYETDICFVSMCILCSICKIILSYMTLNPTHSLPTPPHSHPHSLTTHSRTTTKTLPSST